MQREAGRRLRMLSTQGPKASASRVLPWRVFAGVPILWGTVVLVGVCWHSVCLSKASAGGGVDFGDGSTARVTAHAVPIFTRP